ncbi:MAG: DUF3387 domain-containing protein [Bacteroidota bacterium]|nr:DUF3387 domain-containing protein [Bacteroidota bacterium]MDP4233315.1 DUF3387 domain-containing protein [Bacteroidota bacterium]MDP4242065.1 DUF3387 domain-containing protein [Bacteroidota bacterium]MDP4288657.1 DUF3387 domain-containing protein [Bacteroidota bacterium]
MMRLDLSQAFVDPFEASSVSSQQSKTKRAEIELMKCSVEQALQKMIAENSARMGFLEKFQQMLDDYDTRAHNMEETFDALKDFMQNLDAEGKRARRGGLSEEEMTIFDLLTKPEMELSEKEAKEVKLVAKELLGKLKGQQLVLDWKKKQATSSAVRKTIEEVLDQLPRTCTSPVWQKKCEQVYLHIYESYQGEGRSIYTAMAA